MRRYAPSANSVISCQKKGTCRLSMPRRHDANKPWELELELESVQGNHIPNMQSAEPVPIGTRWGFDDRFGRQFPNIRRRTHNATQMYNCHGLVFGGRRSWINGAPLVRRILEEDRYKQISFEELLPGDIALYVSDKGDVFHSAIVVELPLETDLIKMPKVISKWGGWIESVHLLNECPYAQEPDMTYEYYRMVVDACQNQD